MTVTFQVPSGSVLPSKTAARVFTSTTAIAFAAVRFPDVKRPVEVVWMNGAFVYPYSLASTKVGNVYTVVRQDGWSKDLELHVEERLSAGDFGIGALTPTLYSPLAQWGLIGRNGVSLLDRSGNARDLALVAAGKLSPDLIPGYVAPRSADLSSSDAVFRITGALTVCLRAWWDGTPSTVLLELGDNGETLATNTLYQLHVSGTYRVGYFAESGSGVDIGFDPNVYPSPGRWQFYCLRRDASGVVTINLDDFQETSGALGMPTGGGSSTLRVGRASSGLAWLGGFADINVWNARLSDAQVANVRALMTANTPAPVAGAYSPALYSPVAQYALDDAAPLIDRTGGLDLTSMSAGSGLVHDIVAGKYTRLAPLTGYRSTFPSIGREMTITCRVFIPDDDAPDPTNGRVFVNAGSGASYSSPIQLTPTRLLFAYNEGSGGPGSGVGTGFGLTVPQGRWAFVAARRRADGRMLFNVDDEQQLTATVAQPYGFVAGPLYLYTNSYATQQDGAMADVSFWTVTLTDEQIAEVRASMGMA